MPKRKKNYKKKQEKKIAGGHDRNRESKHDAASIEKTALKERKQLEHKNPTPKMLS